MEEVHGFILIWLVLQVPTPQPYLTSGRTLPGGHSNKIGGQRNKTPELISRLFLTYLLTPLSEAYYINLIAI